MTAARSDGGRGAYRCGVAVALLASLMTVWTTMVRDDDNGMGFFMLVMATGVGWAAAGFAARGMARTMVGIAIMQGLLGVALATAPSTARLPDGGASVPLVTALFAAAWLASAACFRAAAARGG